MEIIKELFRIIIKSYSIFLINNIFNNKWKKYNKKMSYKNNIVFFFNKKL